MTITYPLALPDETSFRGVRMAGNTKVARVGSAFTFASQAQVWQGARWEVDIALIVMKRAAAEPWLAWRLSLNGQEGSFLFGDPAGATPRGTPLGTPVVDGAGQTGTVLSTRGWTPSAAGVLLAGDYISLGTGATTRLHKVLTDVDADGAGDALIDIWPRLREAPADGATITTSNAKGVFLLADNEMPWAEDESGFYEIKFGAVEDL